MKQNTFKVGDLVLTPYGEGIIIDANKEKFLVLHDPNPYQVNQCWLEAHDLN